MSFSSFKKSKKAFSLVEVTMAIGVMSFCLVAMLGMLPVGLSQERKANGQMLAMQALTAVATDFKGTPVSNAKTQLYQISLPRVGEAVQSDKLELDENFKKVSGSAIKAFDISYRVEPPSFSFGSYRLSIRVSKTSRSDLPANTTTDFVESVILKPAI